MTKSSPSVVIVSGTYGKRAIFVGDVNEKTISEALTQSVCEIELNDGCGFVGSDISFLENFQTIKWLRLFSSRVRELTPISCLNEIKHLSLDTGINRFDFDSKWFPNLQHLSCNYISGVESLMSICNLETLSLSHIPHPTIRDMNLTQSLTHLQIAITRKMTSLEGISALPKMHSVTLKALPYLQSIEDIGNCSLDSLSLTACRRIGKIDPISSNDSLRELLLGDCGHIKSLLPLCAVKNLSSLFFYGNTNVVDGKIAKVIRSCPLKKISYKDRRHYDLNLSEAREIICSK